VGRGVEIDDGAVRTCAKAKVVEETKRGSMRDSFMLGSEVWYGRKVWLQEVGLVVKVEGLSSTRARYKR
jgi:hypothetical protein